MGKCSGLKGGGHHRRALDVAEKKRSEKAARKKEQAQAGSRAVILKEILTTMDPDCDLYLDAAICDAASSASSSKSSKGFPPLCRAYFRYDGCTNKRCKFSHEHSISEALANVTSGTNRVEMENDDDNAPTIPALRHLPGILGAGGKKQKRQRPRRRILPTTTTDTAATSEEQQSPQSPTPSGSPLEQALSEGSSAVDTIVACLDADRDVVSLGVTCRHLCGLILDGNGCPSVQLRKYRAQERKVHRRIQTVLATKAVAGSLRYAVGYFEPKPGNSKGKKKSNKEPAARRPMLMFDYENPNVYKAFRESGLRNNTNKANSLSSSLHRDCTL